MRNLESSPQLENPGLVEIKATLAAGQRINEFVMGISITRARAEDDGKKGAAKPAPKKG
jgi:type IV pilus assembly protein PilN